MSDDSAQQAKRPKVDDPDSSDSDDGVFLCMLSDFEVAYLTLCLLDIGPMPEAAPQETKPKRKKGLAAGARFLSFVLTSSEQC